MIINDSWLSYLLPNDKTNFTLIYWYNKPNTVSTINVCKHLLLTMLVLTLHVSILLCVDVSRNCWNSSKQYRTQWKNMFCSTWSTLLSGVRILRVSKSAVIDQGPVVQSILSLTSSLMGKMLTVLVSILSNSKVFCRKKNNRFCNCKSYSYFVSKNISIYTILMNKVWTIR